MPGEFDFGPEYRQAVPSTTEASVGQKQRIDELARLIGDYQAAYYNGEALISDSEFDALWDELKALSPVHPILTAIGSDANATFPKARHIIPMGSQEKAANPEEFRAWALRQEGDEFLVQHKLDGASLELQYEAGKLVRAVTRGDGIVGDDIYSNAIAMQGVLLTLPEPFTGGVRAEVLMSRNIWQEKYRDKANCRNAANGLMRRKDGLGSEDLSLVVYDLADYSETGGFARETEKLHWLEKQGFSVVPHKLLKGADEVIAFRNALALQRDNLVFDVDGVVVKTLKTNIQDLRRQRPEFQIAFKFELEQAISILKEVIWSESGANYTPVGIVEPVRLAGTTVQRANLNNPDQIRALGLKLGLPVFVTKRGEIIPKIEGLAPHAGMQGQAIIFPETCRSCQTPLLDVGSRLYCPNPACPKRIHHRLEKWIEVMEIRELGSQLLDRLFEQELLHSVADLYTLSKDDLLHIPRMGEKSATKVVANIQRRREVSLARFVAGFDIEGLGETSLEKISQAGIDSWEKLFNASRDDFASIHGIGEILASALYEGLREVQGDMAEVLAIGRVVLKGPIADQRLRGLSFCFTGELTSLRRSEAQERVKALGGQAKNTVTKDLSYLVTNEALGSSAKGRKASELGIAILTEQEFLDILNKNSRS